MIKKSKFTNKGGGGGTNEDGRVMVRVPKVWHSRFGSMMAPRGRADDGAKLLFWWDHVQDCHDDCEALVVCEYVKPECKCKVMSNMLMGATSILADLSLPEQKLWRIGTHLMPLYRSLCQLMIAASGIQKTTYINNKGEHKVHPIHKELRDAIEKIDRVFVRIFESGGADGKPLDVPIPNFKRPTTVMGMRKKV